MWYCPMLKLPCLYMCERGNREERMGMVMGVRSSVEVERPGRGMVIMGERGSCNRGSDDEATKKSKSRLSILLGKNIWYV